MKLEKKTNTASRWYDDACGTALALEILGERWALLIVRELMFGPRRFGQLRANLPGISANVLTQRLQGLEASGVLRRLRLPPPADVAAYDLTDWGREALPTIRLMGAWAARSPRHDPLAFLSTASAMISLTALMDPAKARAAGTMTVAFRFPADAFVARLADGELAVTRGEGTADVTFTGDTMALRHTIYGKRGSDGDGLLKVAGDRTKADRFIDLFALPMKVGNQDAPTKVGNQDAPAKVGG